MRIGKNRPVALFLYCLISLSAMAQESSNPACDRACLENYMDRYLQAMESNTVDPALFAPRVKFTENGIRLPLGGEGLWYGMSGRGSYDFYVPDTDTQNVAFIGTVRENSTAASEGDVVAVAIRLRIENERITEVEQLAIRPDDSNNLPPTGVSVEAMGQPHPAFMQVIPDNQRATREELVKTADYYFEGLQRNDGQGYYPFTDDCERFENGMQTTQTNCKQQFEETLRGLVSRIRDRRFVAVDRERGNVFAFAFFDHHNINWTWQLAEIFRVENGEIRRIEAVFHRAPFGINSGWSTYEQGMSEEAQHIR